MTPNQRPWAAPTAAILGLASAGMAIAWIWLGDWRWLGTAVVVLILAWVFFGFHNEANKNQ